MSTPVFGRALVRVLCIALGWSAVLASVFVASAVADSPYDATGMIGVSTSGTALVFLAALFLGTRCIPRVRRITGIRVGIREIIDSGAAYHKQMFWLVCVTVVANTSMPWGFYIITKAQFLSAGMMAGALLIGVAPICHAFAVAAIASMLRETGRDGRHHPVLGVALGNLVPGAVPLLLPQVPMPEISTMSWQAFTSWAVAGAMTFFAALISLWGISTMKK